MEYGWACPRCGKVNAPWKSTCDCSGNTYWYPTWERPYYDKWWTYVTCAPETTWKTPSTMCGSDSSSTYKSDSVTTAWNGNSALDTGGSDYWNSYTRAWENVPKTYTNKVDDMMNRIDHVTTTTTTFYNTGDTQ